MAGFTQRPVSPLVSVAAAARSIAASDRVRTVPPVRTSSMVPAAPMESVTVHVPLMSVATYASTGPSGEVVSTVMRTDLAARVAARALLTTSGAVSRA